MTTFVAAFPVASMAVAAAIPHRNARAVVRIALALAALAATVFAATSMNWLSAIFALTISFLCAVVVVFSTGILPKAGNLPAEPWSRKPAYFILLGGFWSSMLLAVTSPTFLGLWAGISATTIATTFLVAYMGGKAALEAAWKYLMLCSFGIAIALVGMLFLGRAAMAAGVPPQDALSWTAIAPHAALMNVALTRTALALMLVGFATKAGLVPMHAWLPDAHSRAPAPISALLSGVLVSCALYAIVRVQSVADTTISAPLFDAMLAYGGAASMLVASLLMLAQRDLKRLLAYSTVEHAGIVAVALGLATPLALFAALYHTIGHAFAKSLAFLSVGIVAEGRDTTAIGRLHGLWSAPGGRLLVAALIALAGLPPFGLFLSELLVTIGLVQARQWLVLAIALAALSLAFASLARAAVATAAGSPPVAVLARPRNIGLAAGATACVLAMSFAAAFIPFVPWGQSVYALLAAMLTRS